MCKARFEKAKNYYLITHNRRYVLRETMNSDFSVSHRTNSQCQRPQYRAQLHTKAQSYSYGTHETPKSNTFGSFMCNELFTVV